MQIPSFLVVIIVGIASCTFAQRAVALSGESCNDTIDCGYMGGGCINGTCGCPNPSSSYICKGERCGCFIKVGDNCQGQQRFYSPCVSGAYCNQTCICKVGASAALPDGSCRGSIYDGCNNDTDCEVGLSCNNNACGCPSLSYTIQWSPSGSKNCKIVPLSNCTLSSDCVSNAECKSGHCQCNAGSSPTMDGNCGLSFGQPCLTHSSMHAMPVRCNDDVGLTCQNGSCTCPHETYYNNSTSNFQCISRLGGKCGYYNANIACEQNAECVNPIGDPKRGSKLSICKCQLGYKDEGGKCVKS